MDNSIAFKEYANDYIASADNQENLILFSGIAIAAWNLSFVDDEIEIDNKIGCFEEEIGKEEYENEDDDVVVIREKIGELIDIRKAVYAEHNFIIVEADFTSDEEGTISIRLTTQDLEEEDPEKMDNGSIF